MKANKKNIQMLTAIMGLQAMIGNDHLDVMGLEQRDVKPIPKPQKKVVIPKGLKEFKIHGFTVYAINHKNAMKKVQRLATQVKWNTDK